MTTFALRQPRGEAIVGAGPRPHKAEHQQPPVPSHRAITRRTPPPLMISELASEPRSINSHSSSVSDGVAGEFEAEVNGDEAAPLPPPKDRSPVERPPLTDLSPPLFDNPSPLTSAIDAPPLVESPISSTTPRPATTFTFADPNRPRAVTKYTESVSGKTPLEATIYIDPCLRSTLLTVPAVVRATTDSVLTGASAYGDGSFNWTTGAPIGGMAALAKSYILPPDVRVGAENGGVTLRLGVVEEARDGGVGQECKGKEHEQEGKDSKPKGRTKARVEVITSRGGVELDVLELAPNRQLDLSITTGKGDVLLLLPPSFHGPVHMTSPTKPTLRPLLAAQAAELVNAYANQWTTHIVPLGRAPKRGHNRAGGLKQGLMKVVAKYVPEDLMEQDEYHDMAVQAFSGAQKGSHSRIVVKTERGRVVLAYRGEEGAREGLRVGAAGRQKHWWTL